MENIFFSFNAIAPIFVLVFLGAVLKRIGFADEKFFIGCDKVGFQICLPCLLFLDVAEATTEAGADAKLILFCTMATTVFFFLMTLIARMTVKTNPDRGAFVQGSCRSNAAILGVTLATNMYGTSGAALMGTVLSFVVILFNIYSVIVLNLFAPTQAKRSKFEIARQMGKNLVTNPLIISILLALLWKATGWHMPVSVGRSIEYLAGMSLPIALLSLGANFSFGATEGKWSLAILASLIKTVILPAIAVFLACQLGIRGMGLSVVLIIFGAPTAVSSYIMAKQMQSNHSLAGNIMLVSTLVSMVTLFIGLLILKNLFLI